MYLQRISFRCLSRFEEYSQIFKFIFYFLFYPVNPFAAPAEFPFSQQEIIFMAKHAITQALRKLFKPRPQDIVDIAGISPKKGHPTCQDKFSWIENLSGQDTLQYIKSENRYTTIQLLHTKHLRRKVKKYIKKLSSQVIQEDNCRVSECVGNHEYYSESSHTELPVVYRRLINSACKPVPILDHNELAKDTGFVRVKPLKISSSQKFFAVIFNRTGAGSSDCNIYRIASTSSVLIQELQHVSNVEWCNDDATLIVATNYSPGRTNKVYKYSLEKKNMEIVFNENDPRFSIDITKSRDGKYILIHSHSKTCSELYALNAYFPHDENVCIQKREDQKECFVDHMNDYFYALRSSDEDGEYKIARLCSKVFGKCWEDIYPGESNNKSVIQDMELFSENCVVYELNELIPHLTTFRLDNPDSQTSIPVTNFPAVMESFSNQDPTSKTLTYSVTAPIQPLTMFEYDQRTKTTKEIFRSLKNWDSSSYNFKLIKAKSKDGTNIPISLFYSKTVEDLSNAPMMVTVYGSYGVPVDLQFTYEKAFLLSRGWILAFPHVRGGGELGRKWYRSATKLTKKRTFQDLEECLLELHKNSFSSPKKTALIGSSAGGLAVAVLCNNAPQLIKAAVLKVPFVDVYHSMLYNQTDVTSQEYEEWGDVKKNKKERFYVGSYCPYENLKFCKGFPSVYVQTNLEDELVQASIPLKWIAKLRHLASLSNDPEQLILCRSYERGGHFGMHGESNEEQAAEIIAFLHEALELPMAFWGSY